MTPCHTYIVYIYIYTYCIHIYIYILYIYIYIDSQYSNQQNSSIPRAVIWRLYKGQCGAAEGSEAKPWPCNRP